MTFLYVLLSLALFSFAFCLTIQLVQGTTISTDGAGKDASNSCLAICLVDRYFYVLNFTQPSATRPETSDLVLSHSSTLPWLGRMLGNATPEVSGP